MSKIKVLALEDTTVKPMLSRVNTEEAQKNFRQAIGAAVRLRAYAETRKMGFSAGRRLGRQQASLSQRKDTKS